MINSCVCFAYISPGIPKFQNLKFLHHSLSTSHSSSFWFFKNSFLILPYTLLYSLRSSLYFIFIRSSYGCLFFDFAYLFFFIFQHSYYFFVDLELFSSIFCCSLKIFPEIFPPQIWRGLHRENKGLFKSNF